MGDGTQRGRWRIAKRCSVINVMGGADLDLTEAIVDDTEIEIRVFSLMSGSDILVPDGVNVKLNGFALMGGNDLKLEGSAARPGRAGGTSEGVLGDGRNRRQAGPAS